MGADKIHTSVMFLYPQYAQSDFIKDVCEDDTIGDHVSYMFPSRNLKNIEEDTVASPEWDEKKEYYFEDLVFYIEAGCTPALNKSLQKAVERRYSKLLPTTQVPKVITHPD